MTGSLALSATQPKKIIDGVRHRLATQALLHAVLLFVPPLIAAAYMAVFLHRFAWVRADTAAAGGAGLLCGAGILAAWRFRSAVPSLRFVARLIDEKAEAEDRFVTLATIDPATCSPALLSRLTSEAASIQARLELKRHFPFRVQRSFLNSCMASLVAILLFQLWFELPSIFKADANSARLAVIGQRLSRVSGLEKLGESLKALPAQLQDGNLSNKEKRALIEESLARIKERLTGAQRGTGSGEELLRQAANQLNGLEEGLKKAQGKGAGGREEQSSHEPAGSGSGAADGGNAENQSGLKAPIPSAAAPGQAVPGTAPAGGQRKGEGENGQGGERKEPQDNKAGSFGRAPNQGMESKASIGPPNDNSVKTPERFLRPGEEGETGLKGSRFVTVQLPEEETGLPASGAESGGRRKRTGADLPSSNLPLRRPDQPKAGLEKQPIPLEYRGLVR